MDEVTIESADGSGSATTIPDPTVVRGLVKVIDGLHTPFPGPRSCPSTGAPPPPPVLALTFRVSQRPEPVAVATLDLSGCATLRLGVVERLRLGDTTVPLDPSPELVALLQSLQRPDGTLQ